MADIHDLTVMTEADARALGFAGFNNVPHTISEVPDGPFTISAKTSDGRRVTFCFMPYGDGPARFVDIQFHNRGTSVTTTAGSRSPTFNAFAVTKTGRHIVDTHMLTEDIKPTIVVVPLDTTDEEEARATLLARGPKP